MPEPQTRGMAAADTLAVTAEEILAEVQQHHVAKHQGQIRRNVSQFNSGRAKR